MPCFTSLYTCGNDLSIFNKASINTNRELAQTNCQRSRSYGYGQRPGMLKNHVEKTGTDTS